MHTVVESYAKDPAAFTDISPPILTSKEREVLQLIAEGHSVKSIASTLNVSVNTVWSHRSHIMDKLKIDSTAGLVKYAVREGLTSLDP